MLKTCEQFPDGCIIFLDELDALATSRSTGEVAQRAQQGMPRGTAAAASVVSLTAHMETQEGPCSGNGSLASAMRAT
jgi:hypothetical protein